MARSVPPPGTKTARTVDGLQNIYTVVVGLAIAEAIRSIALASRTTEGGISASGLIGVLPAATALLLTLVPFYWGMNRHLYACYVEREPRDIVPQSLLLDFFFFFLETAVLYIIAVSLAQQLVPFYWLGALFGLDAIWAMLTHLINYRGKNTSVLRWGGINFTTVVAGLVVVSTSIFQNSWKAYLFLIIVLVRTVVDFWACWSFYMPED